MDWIFKTPKATYIGFDCAHLGDKTPFVDAMFPNLGFDNLIYPSEVCRDETYIEENCKSLIDQLIKIQKG